VDGDVVRDGRKHVLLDCTAIPANRGGVGRYIEGILSGLSADQVILTLVAQRREKKVLAEIAPWATVLTLPAWATVRPLRFVWEQLGLPPLAARLGVDVIHSPHYTFPLGWHAGRVVTIHDATFFSEPATHELVKRLFFRMWTRLAWRRVDVVITPSVATGTEVTRFLGAPRASLQVAHLGVDSARFYQPSSDQLDRFRKTIGIDHAKPWFAFLGTIEPRKNIGLLLDAYRDLRTELGTATPDLLISGGRGWDASAVARLDNLPQNSGVRELGYLPMNELPALLGGAVAVIYPSVGEGFGLPVLEAMASGAAVVTTDRLAIPEVGGDAVSYVSITAAAIRDAMRELFVDRAENERLRGLAMIRASLFTWHATAAHHVTAYALASGVASP
jgi:glycosyltransferase involved in cell wall biosynthesis